MGREHVFRVYNCVSAVDDLVWVYVYNICTCCCIIENIFTFSAYYSSWIFAGMSRNKC